MAPKEKIILPEKYYLDYFYYLLDFVEKHYDHVLDLPEYEFLQSFRSLSEDAKCLYVRLSNRRGDYFRLSKIQYEEINQLESAKEELNQHSFISINESGDPIQFNLFTKEELLSTYRFLDGNLRKRALLQLLVDEDLDLIHSSEEIMQVLKTQEVDFLKLLFFGNRYGQMTEFVIRDVGNVKIQELDESKFIPWFTSRADALGVMNVSQLKKMLREMLLADYSLEEILVEIPWKEWLKLPRTNVAANKLLLEIASTYERAGDLDRALGYFRLSEKPPSRERQVRILDKLGEKSEAMEIAESIIVKPSNATELTFAKDFLERSGIRIDRSMTKRLRNAESIVLNRTKERVEHQALNYFETQGWNGAHTENYIWKSLFGLAFWEELFDEQHGSFHHPLQRQPSDLTEASFFKRRETDLNQRLSRLKTRNQFLKHLEKIATTKEGTANQFVYWHPDLISNVETLIRKLPLIGVKKVLIEISKNTKENSTGFPDLFLWNANDYHFYEIKSPNDHLSAQQLFWLNFLNAVKIKADIMKIEYTDHV